MMFELQYEPFIISDNQKPWKIASIPWDTETFNFGVSALGPSYDEYQSDDTAFLVKALNAYSKDRQTRLIIASIPAMQVETSYLLQRAGFYLIDTAISVRYENLHALSKKDSRRLSLAPVVHSEMGLLVDMAAASFRHGRYHLDPCLPNALADQRYKDWLSRCLIPDNPQQVLSVKIDGTVCGFSVVEYKGSEGYLHLHAIDSRWQGKKLGHEMIIQSLRYLSNLGAISIGTKISASNLKAINMHSRLNGRFIAIERLLHWHC